MLEFRHLLDDAGLALSSVRLLRHQDNRYPGFPTPYILWRDHRDRFNAYQETQDFVNKAKLDAPYWASFVGLPGNETMFVGLYSSNYVGRLPMDRLHPVNGKDEAAGSCDFYNLSLIETLHDYAGRLFIDWGPGFRSWIQRADSKPKQIVELKRSFSEPEFPGFTKFISDLSAIETLPRSWCTTLSLARGIYVLTCPKTREKYVGSACGIDGFLGRWRQYSMSGHGGNLALKARDPSDYQISILETVGSSATEPEILALERTWKMKLQSKEMGLNRN